MPTSAALPTLLIVDDDPLITDSLSFFLGQEFAISVASARPEAVDLLRSGLQPDLALIDLGLPPRPHRPEEGYQLISDLLTHAPDTRIVMLSGQHEETHARHARALGAFEFVAKPADPERLRQLLHRVLAFTPAESASFHPAESSTLIGTSPPMQKLRTQVQQYADSPFPVLIEGESGSGKEIVARALHQQAGRSRHPIFALNCAAISPNLVEATLFGHAKGAFTGATQTKTGYFEEAGEGTLFLDEIGELPLDLQPKLLRVLENGEYQRVGDTQTRHSKARIVAATNRDLRIEVREGRFRADLYHRLSVFAISVPPLRELGADRHLLLDHFADYYANQAGQTKFSLDDAAKKLWLQYRFPGNVRELRNITIRLTTKYPGKTVDSASLAEELDNSSTLLEIEDKNNNQLADAPELMLAIARKTIEREDGCDLGNILQSWERAYIQAAQELTQGNISQSAKLLGINRTTLYNRIETLEKLK